MTATATAKAIKERPIIYTGGMVRRILADEKTNTRRVKKSQPAYPDSYDNLRKEIQGGEVLWFDPKLDHRTALPFNRWRCPYGQPGDRLWVRETWCKFGHGANGGIKYRADYDSPEGWTWKSPIFMPRWASRIDLEIVTIGVERLHEITEEGAKAEGVEWGECATLPGENSRTANCIHCHKRGNEHVGVSRVCFGRSTCFNPRTYKGGFALLWDQINGKTAPWADNPWVWVIEFRRVK